MIDKTYDQAAARKTIKLHIFKKFWQTEYTGNALEQSAVERDGVEDDNRLASLFKVRMIL